MCVSDATVSKSVGTMILLLALCVVRTLTHALRLHWIAIRIAEARYQLIRCHRERVSAGTAEAASAPKTRHHSQCSGESVAHHQCRGGGVDHTVQATGWCNRVAHGAHLTMIWSSAALHRHFGFPSLSQSSAGARKVPSPFKITSLQLFQSQRVFLSHAISSSVTLLDATDRLALPSPSTMHSLWQQTASQHRQEPGMDHEAALALIPCSPHDFSAVGPRGCRRALGRCCLR